MNIKTGRTKDDKRVQVVIKKSNRTSKLICHVSINSTNISDRPVLVWSSIDRAEQGRAAILSVITEFSVSDLMTQEGYSRFLDSLPDDDDEIIGVWTKEGFDSSESTRFAAMAQANKAWAESGSTVRFRVNGETVI